ncbi:serine hydrolase domain-containing protein [Paraflavitalea speifideaquila]|uniref:serine hydrolase domain-containing protein n=1 Tax=Paraflavitalea speifideaquila TaxID=3076558 RepID=UPI0028E6D970|nr:serine hydrolase domain-containing protein [Paraflavitalea speifideiaquila]
MSLKAPRTCPKFSLFLFFLLFLQLAQAQYDFGAVDQLLEKNKKLLGNNVVALVWKDGKLIYQKEIGADFNGKTQAPIASCSKWITAATIMTLVDQGKISLDDPVSKYIPILDKYMKGYITIRQCLAHTTGIDGKGGLATLLQRRKFENLEEEANAIAAKEISNNPGKEFAYGSSGLNLAARVAEIVSKKDFCPAGAGKDHASFENACYYLCK